MATKCAQRMAKRVAGCAGAPEASSEDTAGSLYPLELLLRLNELWLEPMRMPRLLAVCGVVHAA